MREQIVIVGAGEAGGRAALRLRELQFDGRIILIGEERHLPYERPPLSKTTLMDMARPEAPKQIVDAQNLAANDIEFFPSVRVRQIDRVNKLVLCNDGSRLGYSRLLLATGATSRKMTVEGSDGVLYLRNFANSLALRDKLLPGTELIVIGAGFIGLEVAASAVMRGCKVTILQAGPTVLTRGVPPVLADKIAGRHEAAGVSILTSVEVAGILRQGTRSRVQLADGRVLDGDVVVAGIGAIPATGLAEECGIAVENGVRVDEQLRTDDPEIYAIGDCCSFPHPLYDGRRVRLEAWRNAQEQAAVVAANLMGGNTAYAAVPWFWSDQYEQTLQVAGLYDDQCTTIERRLEGTSIFFHLNAMGRLVAASAVGPSEVIGREIRVSEMLIAQRYQADAARLADPSTKLKGLLNR